MTLEGGSGGGAWPEEKQPSQNLEHEARQGMPLTQEAVLSEDTGGDRPAHRRPCGPAQEKPVSPALSMWRQKH